MVRRRITKTWENFPRSYGRPVLFGIARDPHTLFVYWEIDWPSAFGSKPPADRKVYLRVISGDGTEETKVAVEPFAGNHCVAVSQARSTYRIELGYSRATGSLEFRGDFRRHRDPARRHF